MKTQDVILWTPHFNQLRIVDNKKRFKFVRCGRRFGKTTTAISALVEEALDKSKGLYYYIAPTYKQGKQIAWQMLVDTVTTLPKSFLKKKPNESELYIEFANGSKIYIKGADNPDSLRGVGLDGAVLDEYKDFHSSVWKEIIRPALLDKQGWAMIMGTPKGYNHFYRMEQEIRLSPDWEFFHFTSYDNPLLSRTELDSIKGETPQVTFEQEYMAEYRRFEGLVYQEFDFKRHVLEKLPDDIFFHTRIAGIDFGFNNPAAMVEIGVSYEGVYYVTDVWYQTGKTEPEIVEYVAATTGANRLNALYPDPENPSAIKAMNDKGLPVMEVIKGPGSIKSGIDKIKALFKTNKLFILAKCEPLIFEIETYHYPERRDGFNASDTPVKDNDHALDALRYAIMMSDAGLSSPDEDSNFALYRGGYK